MSMQTPAALINVAFTGGVNEAVTPELVPPGQLLDCRNVYKARQGSLQKREGVTTRATLSRKVVSGSRYKDTHVLFDEYGQCYAFDPVGASYTNVGQASQAMVEREQIAELPNASCADPTVIEYDNKLYYFWCTDYTIASLQQGEVWLIVLAKSDGSVVKKATKLFFKDNSNGYTDLKVARAGNSGYAALTYKQSTSGGYFKRRINLDTYAVDAEVSITSTACNDIREVYGRDDIVICARGRSGVSVIVEVYDATSASLAVLGSVTISVAHTAYTNVAIKSFSDGGLAVAYAFTNAGNSFLRCSTYTLSGSTLTLIRDIQLISASGTSEAPSQMSMEEAGVTGQFVLAYVRQVGSWTASGGFKWMYVDMSTSTTWVTVYETVNDLLIMSRVFAKNDYSTGTKTKQFYLLVNRSDSLDAFYTQYLIQLPYDPAEAYTLPLSTKPVPVAIIAPRTSFRSAASPPTPRSLFSVANVTREWQYDDTEFVTAGSISGSPAAISRVGVCKLDIDFAHPGLYQCVELGESLYIGGGMACVYDGARVTELGFCYSPGTLTQVGVGAAQAVSYYAVLEYSHANGEIARSRPSPALVTTSVPSVSITYKLHHLTKRPGNLDSGASNVLGSDSIGWILYATENGDSIPYRRLTDGADRANDLYTGTTGSFNAGSLVPANTNPIMYTVGGVVENVAPSGLRHVWVHKNRLWGIGDDGKTIWQSKTQVDGEQVAFADEFAFSIPDSGNCVGGMSLGDMVAVFKESSTYIMFGDGPADTNQGGDLSIPQLLSSDIGCIDCRSIARIPLGVVFLSRRGFQILTNARAFSWIGERVQETWKLYPVCVSATVVEKHTHVRFVMQTEDGSACKIFVYDYSADNWFYWDIKSIADVDYAPCTGSFAESDGRWHIIVNDDTTTWSVRRQTEGDSATYTDDAQDVDPMVRTSWVRVMGEIQPYQRVQRVQLQATRIGGSDLAVRFFLDYDEATPGAAITKASADIEALDDAFALQYVPHRQKCKSISVELSGTSVGDGGWLELIALTFKTISKRGPYKMLGSSQRGG